MRPGIKRIVRAGALIAAGILVLIAAGLTVISQKPELMRPVIEGALAPAGGKAGLGGIELDLFPPELTLNKVSIEPPPGQGWRLSLDRLYWRPAWRKVLAGGRWLGRVEVSGPRFDLSPGAREVDTGAGGSGGLETLGLAHRLERVVIREGRLGLDTPAGRLSLTDLSLLPDKSRTGLWHLEAGVILSGEQEEILARAELGGTILLSPGPALAADVALSASAADISWLDGRLDGRLQAGMKVEISGDGLVPGPALLTAKGLALAPVGAALPDLEISLAPKMGPGGSFSAEKVRLSLAGLGELTGRGSYRDNQLDLSLAGQGFGLARAAGRLKPLTGWDPAAWQLAGSTDIALSASGSPAAPSLHLAATVRDLGMASPDGEIMAAKLAGRLGLDVDLGRGGALRAALNVAVTGGEALYSTLYFNLAKAPFDLNLQGGPRGWRRWENIKLSAGLKGFGRLEAGGWGAWQEDGPAFDGRIRLDQASLARLWASLVRDPLSLSRPELAESKAAGTAGMEASARGRAGDWRVEGRLRLKGGGLTLPGMKLEAAGLELDLPFAYRWGNGDLARAKPKKWGRLRLGRFTSPLVSLGRQSFSLALVPNRLVVSDALVLPLWGGLVTMRDLEVFAPLSPQWEARLGMEAKDLNLALAAPPSLPMKGSLGGGLKRVVVNSQRLAAQGSLTGRLFSGEVEVKDLLVLRPFEMGREIGADVDMRLLDLHQLSSALGIGLITGRINGSLEGLRVAYGQPVSFKLTVESVKMDEVEQEVSLKAVNSIAVLGTGSGLSGAGASLITSIMNEFPYRAIGFVCTLNNDVFKINGLIKEDGVEYIVRKPFLAGINVINRNPENYISFKDMLERLRRVVRPRGDKADPAKEES